jgi:hypothetical protein
MQSARNGLEQQENETGKSTDVNVIEEGSTGDSKQIYGDPSTSERKQAVQKFRKSAKNGLEQK